MSIPKTNNPRDNSGIRTIYIKADKRRLWDKALRVAKKEGMTRSELIVKLLENKLRK